MSPVRVWEEPPSKSPSPYGLFDGDYISELELELMRSKSQFGKTSEVKSVYIFLKASGET
ncbi:MAG: hypothetical protein M3Q14_04405 [bacterium]|nr:hypothetical protein [bacterium]